MGTFCFLDRIGEFTKDESLIAYYRLKGDEEFLKDHFEGFPVMPGVLLIESLKQASSALLALSGDHREPFYRLERVGDVKFGQFIKPGSLLKITARVVGRRQDGGVHTEGRIDQVLEEGRSSRVLTAAMTLVPVLAQGEETVRLKEVSRCLCERLLEP